MSAYLRRIAPRRCKTCGRLATQELVNSVNAPVNDYCDRHAQRALEEFERRT